jgi:hypothetical protein
LPLLQKQVTQGSQVGQNSAAGGHVLTQFHSFSGDKLEGFLLAFQAVAFPRAFGLITCLKNTYMQGHWERRRNKASFYIERVQIFYYDLGSIL